jgi:hypothetical protein
MFLINKPIETGKRRKNDKSPKPGAQGPLGKNFINKKTTPAAAA